MKAKNTLFLNKNKFSLPSNEKLNFYLKTFKQFQIEKYAKNEKKKKNRKKKGGCILLKKMVDKN